MAIAFRTTPPLTSLVPVVVISAVYEEGNAPDDGLLPKPVVVPHAEQSGGVVAACAPPLLPHQEAQCQGRVRRLGLLQCCPEGGGSVVGSRGTEVVVLIGRHMTW